MVWQQSYNPAGSAFISTLLAALPVLVLLGLIASGRARIHIAAVAGLGASLMVR